MAQFPMTSQDGAPAQQATMEVARQPRQDPSTVAGFDTAGGFELIQRMAHAFASSTMVPEPYRYVIPDKNDKDKKVQNPAARSNCIIALDMATRMKANPLMVMQNLYIVEGRPSWSSIFIISSINACGKYSPLRFEMRNLAERDVEYVEKKWYGPKGNRRYEEIQKKMHIQDKECIAWAIEKATGERLESPPISIGMAIAEGWFAKAGSKWQTMPDVMLRYRAASFFGKLYAPELLMGLSSAEEARETVYDLEPEPEQEGHYTANVSEMSKAARAETASGPSGAEENDSAKPSSRRGRLPKEEIEALRKEAAAAWEATGQPLSEAEKIADQFFRNWTAATCKKVKAMAAEKLSGQEAAVDVETGEVAEAQQAPECEVEESPTASQPQPSEEPQEAVPATDTGEASPWEPDPGIEEEEQASPAAPGPMTPMPQSISKKDCPATGGQVYLRQCEHCRERVGCPAWEGEDDAPAGGAA